MLEYEDFNYPPYGGWWKIAVLGILIPVMIFWAATNAWISKEAYWPGNRGSGMTVRGETAQALAIVYMSVGLFFHSRWCWGMIGFVRTFSLGTVVSLLLFLLALIHSFVLVAAS